MHTIDTAHRTPDRPRPRARRCTTALSAVAATAAVLAAACGGGSGPTTATRPADEQPTAEVQGVTAAPTAVANPTPEPVTADGVHVVEAGELLGGIAARYGVSLDAIVAANDLADPNLLHIGQELVIPAPAPPTEGSVTPTDDP